MAAARKGEADEGPEVALWLAAGQAASGGRRLVNAAFRWCPAARLAAHAPVPPQARRRWQIRGFKPAPMFLVQRGFCPLREREWAPTSCVTVVGVAGLNWSHLACAELWLASGSLCIRGLARLLPPCLLRLAAFGLRRVAPHQPIRRRPQAGRRLFASGPDSAFVPGTRSLTGSSSRSCCCSRRQPQRSFACA